MNPGENVTVDEQLAGFQGRCPFRQYTGGHYFSRKLLTDRKTEFFSTLLKMSISTSRY